MTAILTRVRFDLRARRRSILLLICLVALAGGTATAAAAGARRTTSAIPRFLDFVHAPDGFVGAPAETLDAIERLPQVVDARRVARMLFVPVRADGRLVPGEAGSTVALWSPRWPDTRHELVVAGRLVRQDRVDEANLNEEAAGVMGASVGTVLRFRAVAPAQREQLLEGAVPEPTGPLVRVRVVGIVRGVTDLHTTSAAAVLYAGNATVTLTSAFFDRFHDRVATFPVGLTVRLRHPRSDFPALAASVRAIAGPESFVGPGSDELVAGGQAQRAASVEALALWIFAAVAALVGLVLSGQAISRLLWLDAEDHATLAALGMTRSQRRVLAMARPGVIALGGALAGAGVAVALSPLTPVGLARRAEVRPGVHVDATVLAIGVLATALAVLGWALWTALAMSRTTSVVASRRGRPAGRSVLVDWAAQSGFGPSAVAGISLAVTRGRGATTNPARAVFTHAVFALAGVCAAITFATSLGRFVDVRSRHGWEWDAVVGNPHSEADVASVSEPLLRGNRGVSGFTALGGGESEGVTVGGVAVQAIGVRPVVGDVLPTIVEGHAPSAPGEVALGGKLLRRLRAHVGGTVAVEGSNGHAPVRIVGRAVVAPGIVNDQIDLGGGAVFTVDGLRRFTDAPVTQYLVCLAPAGRAGALARLRRDFPATVLTETNSAEVANLAHVRSVPLALAGVLAVLACGTMAHGLATSVRRRRRDLAVLKALGLSVRQLRDTVRWQSLSLVLAAAAAGVPLGIAAGRSAWMTVEHRMAVVAPPVVPVPAIPVVLVVTVLVAAVAAALPGRVAARVPAAVVLGTE